jgi:hypothetical protein
VTSSIDYSDTSVEISQPLTIFPKSAHAYIQNGSVMRFSEMNRFTPYCSFENNRVAEHESYQMEPQTLTVKAIYSDYEHYGYGRYRGIRQYRKYLDDDAGPFNIRTVIQFHQNDQNIRQLNCIRWSSDGYDFHLTIDDINTIVGNQAIIVQTPY